ncbi:MAG: 4-(cytidine 5'-diphospho)-2-C-methyl-D-erythritol kinase [Chitinophagaceae bacterium]|nr:4-(cytidine 5'-diphospho)-2-C-methyl-D-erythritol kinase [Chitinophagaceae bacterium]
MVLFPNCKINLGLRVTGKRADGYHDIETIFYPLPLYDALEATTSSLVKETTSPFDLTITGIPIPGDTANNLCRKAWEIIKEAFPAIAPVRMYLHKAIPTGAGLGGGSSDGAHTLLLLNEELQLNLSTEKLLEYALRLGSDCPFFILNKPCFATGRGEKMEDIEVNLSGYYFVVIHPGIHVDTGEAFKSLDKIDDAKRAPSLKNIISQPVPTWRDKLVNDFEEPVFKKHPGIKNIRQLLYDSGAEYAAMTGTGSSVFGIFHNSKKTGNLKTSDKYRIYTLNQHT